MVEISKVCVNCNTHLPISIKQLKDSDDIIYKVKCSNIECKNPNYFVGKPCYDFSFKNII